MNRHHVLNLAPDFDRRTPKNKQFIIIRLRNYIIGHVSEWENLTSGPQWRGFDYAGPVAIFSREAVVVAQSLRNRAR